MEEWYPGQWFPDRDWGVLLYSNGVWDWFLYRLNDYEGLWLRCQQGGSVGSQSPWNQFLVPVGTGNYLHYQYAADGWLPEVGKTRTGCAT